MSEWYVFPGYPRTVPTLINTSVGALEPNSVTTQLEDNAAIEAKNICQQQLIW